MRNVIMLIISAILLFGCAGQKFYISKGVAYPGKPAQELEAMYKFSQPLESGCSLYEHTAGAPLAADDMLYLPVKSSYRKNDEQFTYSTVYAIDSKTDSVTDSLVLRGNVRHQSFLNLVRKGDFLVVGLRDSLCYIVKTDAHLKEAKDIATGIKFSEIYFAGLHNDKLRLVGKDKQGNVMLYELVNDTLKVERKRLLTKGIKDARVTLDNKILWFFITEGDKINTIKIDLAGFDPVPVYKSVSLPLAYQKEIKNNQIEVSDSLLYLTRSEFGEKTGWVWKMAIIDYNSGKVLHENLEGYWQMDLVKNSGKEYAYKLEYKGQKDIFSLVDISKGWSEQKTLLTFAPTAKKLYGGWMTPEGSKIYPMGDKIYLTGCHYLNLGKTEAGKSITSLTVNDMMLQPLPFLAVYSER